MLKALAPHLFIAPLPKGASIISKANFSSIDKSISKRINIAGTAMIGASKRGKKAREIGK